MCWFLPILLLIEQFESPANAQLTYCQRWVGETNRAEMAKAYLVALDDAKRRVGPESSEVATIFTCLGDLRASENNYLLALEALQESLRILEKLFGREDVGVGFTIARIAMLKHKQGYDAQADALYGRAHAILENNLGQAPVGAALLDVAIAKLYLAQHRNTEAELLLEKAIPVLEKAGDRDERTLAVALTQLAEAYLRDGRYAKAEPLYGQVLRILAQRPSAMNEDILADLQAYARMLRRMKRKLEADQLEEQIKMMLSR